MFQLFLTHNQALYYLFEIQNLTKLFCYVSLVLIPKGFCIKRGISPHILTPFFFLLCFKKTNCPSTMMAFLPFSVLLSL